MQCMVQIVYFNDTDCKQRQTTLRVAEGAADLLIGLHGFDKQVSRVPNLTSTGPPHLPGIIDLKVKDSLATLRSTFKEPPRKRKSLVLRRLLSYFVPTTWRVNLARSASHLFITLAH